MLVTITPLELDVATNVARRIHDGCRKRGCRDAHGATDITIDDEITGHAAEAVVAKVLRVKCNSFSSGRYGPDVGTRTQVRSSSKPGNKCLLIRDADLEKYGNVPFVLVLRRSKFEFEVMGWRMSYDAPIVGYRTNAGNYNRPPMYLIYPKNLFPINTLENP